MGGIKHVTTVGKIQGGGGWEMCCGGNVDTVSDRCGEKETRVLGKKSDVRGGSVQGEILGPVKGSHLKVGGGGGGGECVQRGKDAKRGEASSIREVQKGAKNEEKFQDERITEYLPWDRYKRASLEKRECLDRK